VSEHFVEWHGAGVQSVKTAFKTAVRLAKLSGKLTPHTLRHTAATWLMQRGAPIWQAAGYLGMSAEMLDRVYGHHSPEHLKQAAEAITGKKVANVSVVVSVVAGHDAGKKPQKSQ
jgi:integrase